ncbi:unnamed protein product [Mycena citricolor]|uniref:glucan 1,3-beta-glucosidase n=1 Tax=Mycena citricolor TaxID=2018698 RepID=A0AAD2I121_9AGAR|nr:unnamed protein product [Mycena citricolor]CAK5284478.1 unnamed protein product [Mycena citricolor]
MNPASSDVTPRNMDDLLDQTPADLDPHFSSRPASSSWSPTAAAAASATPTLSALSAAEMHNDAPDAYMPVPSTPGQRFLGHALYEDDPGRPARDSYFSESSQPTLGGGSAAGYAKDDSRAASTIETEGGLLGLSGPAVYPGAHDPDHATREGGVSEKRAGGGKPSRRRRGYLILAGVLLILAVALGVGLGVGLSRHAAGASTSFSASGASGDASSSTGAAASPSSSVPPAAAVLVTGGDGSTITADNGTTFTYVNSFGGSWYYDVNDPFNNGARPQSWSPALNETFRYGIDTVRGVNLGGWLVTEPFIVPALYQTIQSRKTTADANINIVDEWTLMQALELDTANGGTQQLINHYETFITEQDFMQIAAAGLNFVRIPLPYWAIDMWDGEGFLPKVSWTYFLKAVKWARKYGIRINLDLHSLPGSQNGWNHSGRLGSYNVIYGPMGLANAQRALDYIRVLSEFISQPEYSNVVTMFGIMNEPQGNQIGLQQLSSFYYEAYKEVRLASGFGQGNGPMVSLHNGFLYPLSKFSGMFDGADRVSLDYHPYLCFGTPSAQPITSYGSRPCSAWGYDINSTMQDFGLIVAGEWSVAVTDCGLYLNGVGLGTRYEGTLDGYSKVYGDCAADGWLDWENWDKPTKAAYQTFALASMDALQNWFYWTWKVGASTAGRVETPQWSYLLGLQHGWIPKDPRQSLGQCGGSNPFNGPLSAWQTGGPGAGTMSASVQSALSPWPPQSISFAQSDVHAATDLPRYSPSGAPVTLPGPTFTAVASQVMTTTVSAGGGWANPTADTAGMMSNIPGCTYLDPWIGSSVSPPAPLCTGAVRRLEEAIDAVVTPAP